MRDRNDLHWHRDGQGLTLYVGQARHPVLFIVPDPHWPGMWRIQHPDGAQSDIANLTRIRDAACALALTDLNALDRGKRPVRAPPVRFLAETVQ